MNKLVIFDLDGVLIDSRDMHYEALNCALSKVDEKYAISRDEHLSVYDGLPTSRKLTMLTENKNLSADKHQKIWEEKQKATISIFSKLNNDHELMYYFQQLKTRGFQIAVASNSIRNTVKLVLLKLGLLEFIDYYVSNEDVVRNKPFPEMYWKCMTACNALPKDTEAKAKLSLQTIKNTISNEFKQLLNSNRFEQLYYIYWKSFITECLITNMDKSTYYIDDKGIHIY